MSDALNFEAYDHLLPELADAGDEPIEVSGWWLKRVLHAYRAELASLREENDRLREKVDTLDRAGRRCSDQRDRLRARVSLLRETLNVVCDAADVVMDKERDAIGDDWSEWGDLRRLADEVTRARRALQESEEK